MTRAARPSATPRRCTQPAAAAPPGRRGVARVARRSAGRPAERGRVHRRRHRGDNLAVKGLFWARRAADPRRRRILASAVEHHAVLDAALWLAEHEGAAGRVAAGRRARPGPPGDARGGPRRATPTRSPSSRSCGPTTRSAPSSRSPSSSRSPTGTASRSTPTPCRRSASCRSTSRRSGLDAMTVTGHKIGGPIGRRGAAARPRRSTLTPVLHGGGQERDVRSGTLDAPAIVGFAAAAELAVKRQPERAERAGPAARRPRGARARRRTRRRARW